MGYSVLKVVWQVTFGRFFYGRADCWRPRGSESYIKYHLGAVCVRASLYIMYMKVGEDQGHALAHWDNGARRIKRQTMAVFLEVIKGFVFDKGPQCCLGEGQGVGEIECWPIAVARGNIAMAVFQSRAMEETPVVKIVFVGEGAP